MGFPLSEKVPSMKQNLSKELLGKKGFQVEPYNRAGLSWKILIELLKVPKSNRRASIYQTSV